MCLALYKPKNKRLPKEYAQNAFLANSNGAGFAVRLNGRIEIHKGFMDFKTFWEDFSKYEEDEAIVHFRLATHGSECPENTHPFTLGEDSALIHNGILNIQTDKTKNITDTETYIRLVIEPMIERGGADILHDPSFKYLIETSIKGSKFVALTPERVIIYNEKDGHWKDGIWYSNKTYEPAFDYLDFPSRRLADLSASYYADAEFELEDKRALLSDLYEKADEVDPDSGEFFALYEEIRSLEESIEDLESELVLMEYETME